MARPWLRRMRKARSRSPDAWIAPAPSDGVDAGFGPAVMARRPAALEAAIEDGCVAGGVLGHFHSCGFDFRCAGFAEVCADVEIRQLAFKQKRICERIEWQSYRIATPWIAFTRSISAVSAS